MVGTAGLGYFESGWWLLETIQAWPQTMTSRQK